MKFFVSIFIAVLIVLHQDYWQWGRDDLIGGFLPYALAYHMTISLATAAVWLLAVKFCWPHDVEDVDEIDDVDQMETAEAGGRS